MKRWIHAATARHEDFLNNFRKYCKVDRPDKIAFTFLDKDDFVASRNEKKLKKLVQSYNEGHNGSDLKVTTQYTGGAYYFRVE